METVFCHWCHEEIEEPDETLLVGDGMYWCGECERKEEEDE